MRRRRQRRQRRQPADQLGRWLISYADYMTLMFALFVVLYALGVFNRPAFKPAIEAIHRATAKSDSRASQDPLQGMIYGELLIDGNGGLRPDSAQPGSGRRGLMTQPELTLVPDPQLGVPLQQLAQGLADSLQPLLERQLVELRLSDDWLTLRLNATLVFASGSATLSRSAEAILAEITASLGASRNYIRVRGYTDSQPVADELYHSNWQLSARRATAVLAALERQGIASPRLALEGHGQNDPVASNHTPMGRARNRRVEIAVSRFAWEPAESAALAGTSRGVEPGSLSAPVGTLLQDADTIQVFRLPHGGLRITTRREP